MDRVLLRTTLGVSCLFGLALTDRVACGEEPVVATSPAAPVEFSWASLAREIALHVIPENYRDDRHWDKTEKVASGVKVKTKGGQVRFEQREKKVNHGFWRRFSMSLINPDKTLELDIRNIRKTPDGATRFDLFVAVRARCETQFALWTWGVKGINGTVESDVTVQALLDCSFRVDSEFMPDSLLPVFVVQPHFHDLDLKLTDVDTRKIGLLGGWVAEELGNGTRKAFEDLLQSQERPLLERIRKTVAKKQDRLRLNPADAARLFAR
ncbi:hypothetical protein Pan44_34050 [Caulifigura coniformis]|uniref:Uncharacterized protein n=1 Tax=Caulifigura coniformis TaxID=2527983 RepID=A0A517SGW8_9PLAN|nr:hypothetical protein [Caulifigura coniformis]QDT55362.1 hypothetical protein Pan44_34050 [Caulifigura coniformis]